MATRAETLKLCEVFRALSLARTSPMVTAAPLSMVAFGLPLAPAMMKTILWFEKLAAEVMVLRQPGFHGSFPGSRSRRPWLAGVRS